MTNYCKTIGALAAASALVAGNALAGTTSAATTSAASSTGIEYELHTGYSSEYLFRGLNLGDDLVEVGVDASTEWNGLGLSAGAWYGSFSSPKDDISSDELDLYAEVSKDLGFVTAAVGYINYIYPQGGGKDYFDAAGNTQEVYFSLSRDFGFAAASLTYFWEVDGSIGDYAELGLSRSFEFNSCLTLNVGSNVGFLVSPNDFTSWTTKVSLDYGFVENAKLSPFVAYSLALDNNNSSIFENEFVGGTMLSVSF